MLFSITFLEPLDMFPSIGVKNSIENFKTGECVLDIWLKKLKKTVRKQR